MPMTSAAVVSLISLLPSSFTFSYFIESVESWCMSPKPRQLTFSRVYRGCMVVLKTSSSHSPIDFFKNATISVGSTPLNPLFSTSPMSLYFRVRPVARSARDGILNCKAQPLAFSIAGGEAHGTSRGDARRKATHL
jgi:hypothetical protein